VTMGLRHALTVLFYLSFLLDKQWILSTVE
jgi:hypothetical protein